MPQMAPMMWLILFFFFSACFLIFNFLNFFSINNSKNFKFFKKMNKKKNFFNWSW